jgi:site-specific DNA-methyltransferase (adenine-specific)
MKSPETLMLLHQDDTLSLHLGDVLETLASLPEASVDLIFADPPYNLSNNGFTCHAGKRVSVNKGKWDKSNGVQADFDFHRAWIQACHRVLKPNGSLWISGTYHSIYACGFALQLEGWHVINDVAWFKPNAAPNLSCRMFTASHETLIWARKSKTAKHTFNYDLMKNGVWHEEDFIKKPEKQMRSVWASGTPKPHEKAYGKHPTQKPELLLRRIVIASSLKGDVVLDPFCGSGTTGVVALQHGRSFIGIDQNREYLEGIAIRRLLKIQYFKESRQLFTFQDTLGNTE